MDAKYPTDIFRIIHANNGLTLNELVTKTGWDQKIVADALEYLSHQKLTRITIDAYGTVRFHSRISNKQQSILDW